MDTLGPYELAAIARGLSRRDCIRWSLVNKHFSSALQELCDLRLTSKQAEVVNLIVNKTSERWKSFSDNISQGRGQLAPWQHRHYGHYKFPSEYAVASGPSTGKTAIALYTAAKLLRLGKPTLLCAPLKLCHQWLAEHAKFAEQFKLPAICMIHPNFNQPHEWQHQLSQGALGLVPISVMQMDEGDDSRGPVLTCLRALLQMHWEVMIIDDSNNVPHSIVEYGVKASKDGKKFHAISLNASHGGEAMVQYGQDADLGQLPRVSTLIEYSELDCKWEQKTAKAIAFIQAHRGKKTLVVTDNAQYSIHGFKNWFCVSDQLFSKLGGWNSAKHKGIARSEMIQQFAAASEGLLLAPTNYVQRGFSLYCDSVIVLDIYGRASPRVMLQLLGRVRRVESPFSKVSLCILQGTPIQPQDLAFHAMALSAQDTSKLIHDSEWFHHAAESYEYVWWTNENGKRIKLSGLHTHGDPIKTMALLKRFFPEAVSVIKHYSNRRLVVEN